MLNFLILLPTIVMTFYVINYNEHYFKTGDTSLQGTFEHIKEKYWNKKQDAEPCKMETFYRGCMDDKEDQQPVKHRPRPGSEADYERWKAERQNDQQDTDNQ